MNQLLEITDVDDRRVLDVSKLPNTAMGSRAPVWWGNTLLMFIESTTVMLLLVSYFYLRRNFTQWPPPQPNAFPPLFRPVPDLMIPLVESVLLLLSMLPMYLTNRAARLNSSKGVKTGLVILFAITLVAIALRFMEMRSSHLKFRWDDNAYGSLVWTILGLHLTYLLGAAAEFFIIGLWIFRHDLDPKHGLDVTLMGIYWYWTVATWVLCFATVYIGARVL